MPLSPLWANLPRRKCDDCGKTYKPVKPLREGERGFCCANCRKSYHKHGGAYRKLKGEMKKMVMHEMIEMERRVRESIMVSRVRDIVREELREARIEEGGVGADYIIVPRSSELSVRPGEIAEEPAKPHPMGHDYRTLAHKNNVAATRANR
jgi:hypothetical protein